MKTLSITISTSAKQPLHWFVVCGKTLINDFVGQNQLVKPQGLLLKSTTREENTFD